MVVSASIPKIDIKGLNDHRVVIWWHSAIKKNSRDHSQPVVVVSLRVIYDDETYGPVEKRQFSVTYLGFLRIGSIWHNRRKVGEIEMDSELFHGNVTSKNMRFSIQGETAGGTRQYVIPRNIHDLEDDYFHNQSWLLELPMLNKEGEDANLIIPCLEVFTRLYGRNAEVRRILTTYPWEEASNRLFVPEAGYVDENIWGVELRDRMLNSDTFLIAYLQHDEHARTQAKLVWSQIEASQHARGNKQAFFRIQPWLLEYTYFKVKGFWIDSKRFLGLQINGANIESVNITVCRSRTYGVPESAKVTEGESGGALVKVFNTPPEHIDVTGEFPPDHNSGHLDIEEDDFEVLGERGKVIRDNHGTSYQPRGRCHKEDDSKAFSAGEAYGTGKGIGKAEMKSDIVIESHGMLRDFWDALLMLSKTEPYFIQKVEFFSNCVFIEGNKPTLVAFKVLYESDKLFELCASPWGYLNVREGRLRGVLIARVIANDSYVYFIEIQRRMRLDESKEDVVKEESYRGVVFRLNNDDEFLPPITMIMRNLVENKGRLTLSSVKFEGEISSYVHRTKSAKKVDATGKKLIKAEMCQTVVKNAIGKVMEKMEVEL